MTGHLLTLTEHQYEELARYEDGRPTDVGHRLNNNLIRRAMLDLDRGAGRGFYRITTFGRQALERYREGHGIAPSPPRRLLVVTYDATGLDAEELAGLELEAAVQAESSEHHGGVKVGSQIVEVADPGAVVAWVAVEVPS